MADDTCHISSKQYHNVYIGPNARAHLGDVNVSVRTYLVGKEFRNSFDAL